MKPSYELLCHETVVKIPRYCHSGGTLYLRRNGTVVAMYPPDTVDETTVTYRVDSSVNGLPGWYNLTVEHAGITLHEGYLTIKDFV